MWRTLMVVFGIISGSILMAEGAGLGVLWLKGCLTPQNLADIRSILAGESRDDNEIENEDAKLQSLSEQDIQNRRVLRVLDLESREKELDLMKTMALNTENRLISDRNSFDNMREAFRDELEELNARYQSAAVEQARAVLLAMLKNSPEATVERLMALELDDAVVLVRGMPEKSIAQLLQEFDTPTAKEVDAQKQRGREIFEALNRGEPIRTLIQNTLNRFPQDKTGRKGSTDG